MSKYIVTGVAGFIGRHFLQVIPDTPVIGIYHQNPPPTKPSKNRLYLRHDLTTPINDFGADSDYDIVIHCASYAHINKCEVEKNLGAESLAWKGNVVATQNVIDYCKKNDKKLVYLSTECVFSGEEESYVETDIKKPKSWYGYTKSVSEDLILNSGLKNYLIIRGVVAYGQGGVGSNIIQGIVNDLIYKGKAKAVNDQKISFTYIDDITKGILKLVEKNATGIYHIAGSQINTPYELALKVCKRLGIPASSVTPISMDEFFGKEEAMLRLKSAVLNTDKFTKKTKMKTLSMDQGLEKIFVR